MSSASSIASRLLNPALASRVMSADEAAALIGSDTRIGMSGFRSSGGAFRAHRFYHLPGTVSGKELNGC